MRCKCTFREKVVGDGCHICNPEFYKEILEGESHCHKCQGTGIDSAKNSSKTEKPCPVCSPIIEQAEYFNEGTPFKSMSQSMGVNTKPAHRFEVGEFWVLIDPNMPEEQFETIKAAATLWESIKNLELDAYPKLKEKHLNSMKQNEVHVNELVKQIEQLTAERDKLTKQKAECVEMCKNLLNRAIKHAPDYELQAFTKTVKDIGCSFDEIISPP